jgi:hypothetical protein
VGPQRIPFRRDFEGDFFLSRKGAETQRIKSLTAYLPWGGAKNKFLGGFAALRAITFEICILAETLRGGQAMRLCVNLSFFCL